jgi:GNAT superfamily N-acetyltransferase
MIHLRAATPADVPQMHRVRLAVRENRLGDGSGISEHSYADFLKADCAWVAEADGAIAGFAIVDPDTSSIWALFVDPRFEGSGIGKALHDRLTDCARALGLDRLFLDTSEGTRAEQFYRRLGWIEIGTTESGELRFELRV